MYSLLTPGQANSYRWERFMQFSVKIISHANLFGRINIKLVQSSLQWHQAQTGHATASSSSHTWHGCMACLCVCIVRSRLDVKCAIDVHNSRAHCICLLSPYNIIDYNERNKKKKRWNTWAGTMKKKISETTHVSLIKYQRLIKRHSQQHSNGACLIHSNENYIVFEWNVRKCV